MLLDGCGLLGHVQFRHAFFGEIPSMVVVAGEFHASMVVHLHQILGPALFLAAQFQRQEQSHLRSQVPDLVPECGIVAAVFLGERCGGDHDGIWNVNNKEGNQAWVFSVVARVFRLPPNFYIYDSLGTDMSKAPTKLFCCGSILLLWSISATFVLRRSVEKSGLVRGGLGTRVPWDLAFIKATG